MSKTRRPGQKQATRRERRRTRDNRRTRVLLIGAIVLSAVILTAWFPASALYRQRASLAEANSQLTQLHQQDAALSQERKNLSDTAAIGRIARQQYQLVSPGQQAFEVLPPAGTAPANSPYGGDPGNRSPVAPLSNSALPAGSVTTTTQPTTRSSEVGSGTGPVKHGSSIAPGLLQRMAQALEFWR